MAGPAFRAAPVRVRVPATSANLGPGFDAFGLALGLYDDVVVRVVEGGLSIDVAGEGADAVPRDESHLVVRALRAAFDVLGGQPRGLELVCANRIPHGRGLGSSAAAIVTGVIAARALMVGGSEKLDDDSALALASQLEGHPDNVAACLRGGFTIAWTDERPAGLDPKGRSTGSAASFRPSAVRLEPSPEVVPVIFIPSTELSTAKARGLLPAKVPHADASHNAGRAALFVEALTRRPDLLMAATEDRLHQDYRAPAMTESSGLVHRLRAEGIPAVISGAGPTVLALTSGNSVDQALSVAEAAWRVEQPGIDSGGATVLPVVG